MSKYNRKKENPALVQTDEFVSFWEHAFRRVQPFARAIGWTLIGFVVVVAIFGGVTASIEHRAEGATEAWGRVVRIYENELISDTADKDQLAKDEEKAKLAGDEVLPRFKTAKERAEATLHEIDALTGPAAKSARLFRAGVLYDLERYEEARAAYALAADDVVVELAVVAREGVALSLEQLNKLDDAIQAYDKVAPKDSKATEFYRDRALFGLGRLYEKKGDKAQALDRYKEIVAKHPTSSVREDAQNRIAVLEAA